MSKCKQEQPFPYQKSGGYYVWPAPTMLSDLNISYPKPPAPDMTPAYLRAMLDGDGAYLVTVRGGRIVKVARCAMPTMYVVSDPPVPPAALRSLASAEGQYLVVMAKSQVTHFARFDKVDVPQN